MVKKASKGKASHTKLNNKHKTKLAKRGDLKHQKDQRKVKQKERKLRLLGKLPPGSQNDNTVHHDVPEPVIEDEGFYENADTSFARSIISAGKKRNKHGSLESQYESGLRARQWVTEEVEHLLPIKDKHRFIHRTQKIPEAQEPEPELEDEEPVMKKPKGPPPNVSVIDLYAKRQAKLTERQRLIANLSCAIVEDPNANIRKLKTLRELWEDPDPQILMANRKMVLLSLTEIFKDIIPDYKMRVATQTEKQQAATSETKQMRNFEENLLYNYKMFLQTLEECIGSPQQPRKVNRDSGEDPKSKKVFRLLAVKCLCQVFTKHPSFNFSKNIVSVLVPLITVNNKGILEVVCSSMKQIFKEDKEGDTSLEIVRHICKIVKQKLYRIGPRILDVFMALKIKEIKQEEERSKKLTFKEKKKIMSRNERKRDKKRKELDKQLEEANLERNATRVLRIRTDIITAIFTLYFIILKKAPDSMLMSSVLAGLAKFAHLINVDFFDDLFKVFTQLLSSETLSLSDTMNIVRTAFTILSGQGQALNVDAQQFYTHLYRLLPQLASEEGRDLIPHLEEIIKLSFLDRKKKVTNARVNAFTKRILFLSVQLTGDLVIPVLTAAKSLLTTFACTNILFDPECVGSGIYQPTLDEPEFCNAHNSTILYELHLLANHPMTEIKNAAKQILKGSEEHRENRNCLLCREQPENLLAVIEKEMKT